MARDIVFARFIPMTHNLTQQKASQVGNNNNKHNVRKYKQEWQDIENKEKTNEDDNENNKI